MFNTLAVHKRVTSLGVAVDALPVHAPETRETIEQAFCATLGGFKTTAGLAQPAFPAFIPEITLLKVAALLALHSAVGLFANHAVQRSAACRPEENKLLLRVDACAVERAFLLKRTRVVEFPRGQVLFWGQLDEVVVRLLGKSPPVLPVFGDWVPV